MSLLFRSFWALPPMETSTGVPTGALYGLSSLLLKLLREHEPRALALALDLPRPTFRHEALPTYKSSRARAPDPLRAQLARVPELIEALGVPAHAVPGFEADDVLATLARHGREQGLPVLVVTGDTDLLQVARGSVAVWFVGRRQSDAVRYDEAAVRARYGIDPERLPAYKALVGDRSDDLPGVPGIGKKTATRLVDRYGDAAGVAAQREALPARARDLDVAALLRDEDLATVRDELPLREPWWAPVDPAARARLRAWFAALEFRSLLPRLDALS